MEYAEIVKFHGHSCPGSAIGYRMTLAAMKALDVTRSGDEELVAITENDACGVDALQIMSGCTFGKGNLIFRDYGKPVFTLFSRKSGKGVRVRFIDDAIPADAREDRGRKLEFILSALESEIVSLTAVTMDLPEEAKIYNTLKCEKCHEPVMETRVHKGLCIPCAKGVVCE